MENIQLLYICTVSFCERTKFLRMNYIFSWTMVLYRKKLTMDDFNHLAKWKNEQKNKWFKIVWTNLKSQKKPSFFNQNKIVGKWTIIFSIKDINFFEQLKKLTKWFVHERWTNKIKKKTNTPISNNQYITL